MNNNILRISKPIDRSHGKYGYGGSNRTLQIDEILTDHRIGWNEVAEYKKNTTAIARLFAALGIFLEGFRFRFTKWKLGQVGKRVLELKCAFENHKGRKVLLIEESYDFVAYFMAKKFDYTIIAFPHNLETLMSGKAAEFYTNRPWPYALMQELRYNSHAAHVYCISREENWLFNANAIAASYLPYFPPKIKLEALKAIKKRRELSRQEDVFLIISKKKHNATKDGTIALLSLLNNLPVAYKNIRFVIIGSETEYFKQYVNRENIEIIGTVDHQQLEEYYVKAKALIVFQSYGVGALTKITDALLSGLPVIANTHAARSFYDFNGVYTFDTSEELQTILKENLIVGNEPTRPYQAIDTLVTQINQLQLQ